MDKKLAEDFDKRLKIVMAFLSQKLAKNTGSNALKAVAVMETKKALYDICFEKANEYLNQTD